MNGTSQLGGWVIVLAVGRTFVGQRKDVKVVDRMVTRDIPGSAQDAEAEVHTRSAIVLSPVYEYARQLMQGPGGQMAIGGMATPVLLFGNITRLEMPADSIVIPFTTLSEEERAALVKQIDSAEQMRMQMSAATAGIALAGPGVKLPPPPGRKP